MSCWRTYYSAKKILRRKELLLILGGILFVAFLRRRTTEEVIIEKFVTYVEGGLEDSLHQDAVVSCVLPDVDPFDARTLPFVEKLGPLNCAVDQPDLTSLNDDGVLSVNQTALRILLTGHPNLHCTYIDIWWADNDSWKFSTPKNLSVSQKISSDICSVLCMSGNKTVYENVHTYVKRLEKVPEPRKERSRPSVLMVTIDSTSRLNFIRNMPKTYQYLTASLGAIVFKGMNQIGRNTFPNIIPMLTGLKLKGNKYFLPSGELFATNPAMVDLPFIWKEFRRNGYLTLYAEDMPMYDIFGYVETRFKEPPVDYYMRTFWIAAMNTAIYDLYYCYAGARKHNLIMNYARQFLTQYKDVPYYAMPFSSELTHGDMNRAQWIDEDLRDFLQNSIESHLLDNTILIVMGDHGSRYGKYRETKLGRIEANMPFFSIRIPPWLNEKYPHLTRNLKRNSERLTTWYDVHEMLVDVYLEDLQEGRSTSEERPRLSLGMSLFRELVPPNRTCHTANIPQEFCACVTGVTPLSTDDPLVLAAARRLVDHLNTRLSPVTEQCYPLTLKRLYRAIAIRRDTKQGDDTPPTDLRIVVVTSPNDAVLEAMMQRTEGSGSFVVNGEVSRINMYGNQSACIHTAALRPYCMCRQ